MERTRRIIIGMIASIAAIVLGFGTAAPAQASTASPGTITAACQQVYQYQVHTFGHLTDAEQGGFWLADVYPGALFNVRIHGNPRYWGWMQGAGWGWFMANKLHYTGNTWCE